MKLFKLFIKPDEDRGKVDSVCDESRRPAVEFADRVNSAIKTMEELQSLLEAPILEHVQGYTTKITWPADWYEKGASLQAVCSKDGPLYARIILLEEK